MTDREIPLKQAYRDLGKLVKAARYQRKTTTITENGKPAAIIAPAPKETPMPTPITLISATQGDQVPGTEISDPECPIEWGDLPADAQQWAEAQGYGEDESELLYVVPPEDEAPEGYPTYLNRPTP